MQKDKMKFMRTDSLNQNFINLVNKLDRDLAIRDGKDHAFYNQFNSINNIKHVVVAFKNGEAIACGAMKLIAEDTMEIKRMFTEVDYRGHGIASKILLELEFWAKEIGIKKCLLETGIRQPEAIALYSKNGYHLIENYAQYKDVQDSRCFEKTITLS